MDPPAYSGSSAALEGSSAKYLDELAVELAEGERVRSRLAILKEESMRR